MVETLTKEYLSKLYYKQNKSYRDLAKITGLSTTTIRKRFKDWGFKSRSLKESCKLRCELKPQTNPGRKNMPKNPNYGKANHAYKKGYWINVHGYKKISVDGEERIEHRYIWEQFHQKPIPPRHQIHHINGDKLDNRIENLQCMTNSEHQKLHNQPREETTGRFINKEDEE